MSIFACIIRLTAKELMNVIKKTANLRVWTRNRTQRRLCPLDDAMDPPDTESTRTERLQHSNT